MIRHIPYPLVRDFCRALGHEPDDVREIRLRAPGREAEITLYARTLEGGKYLDEDGYLATRTYTLPIEALDLEEDELEEASA